LRNPWSEKVGVYRNGELSEELSGELLEFTTTENEEIMIVPEDKNVTDLELKVSPSGTDTGIWELGMKISGKELNTVVGKY